MLERIVTGGQTGVDQSAWRAAREAGLATGGWMPRSFATEAGPHPEFGHAFGAQALDSDDVADRTLANVRDSDATLVLATADPSPGTDETIRCCQLLGRPLRVVRLHHSAHSESHASEIAAWLAGLGVRVLNVAGPRESSSPGVGALAETFLRRLFAALRP
jgi:hypothetical protein